MDRVPRKPPAESQPSFSSSKKLEKLIRSNEEGSYRGRKATRTDSALVQSNRGKTLASDQERTVKMHSSSINLSAPPQPNPDKSIRVLTDLASLSPLDLVRLIVEGKLLDQENGCYQFEQRDPGCIQKMAKGFAAVTKDLSNGRKAISAEWLKELHKQALGDKFAMNYDSTKELDAGLINARHIAYKFISQKIYTTQGLVELYDVMNVLTGLSPSTQSTRPPFLLHSNDLLKSAYLPKELAVYLFDELTHLDKAEIEAEIGRRISALSPLEYSEEFLNDLKLIYDKEKLNGIFCETMHENFNREEVLERCCAVLDGRLERAKSNEEIYENLAYFLQYYFYIHPFTDGNLRTVMLACNHTLMHFGLPPLMMHDPNIVLLYDCERIKQELIKGSENTLSLLKFTKLHDYDFDLLSDYEKQECAEFIHPLLDTLNEIKKSNNSWWRQPLSSVKSAWNYTTRGLWPYSPD
ncbi:hypothetical protein EOPP23_08400 [Endozoicomonas sp. OPT23]|uniref:Fic family protein n=1 Tax=Endozoicomonas sp. OPT23 TaxID=2072845 RepID=UPI00129AFBD5|nr:Fic family protein [Endozoicomonas sp. OPT23]MRI33001.1 hypothetical protein [Endozoicomonas sp. OPT23]